MQRSEASLSSNLHGQSVKSSIIHMALANHSRRDAFILHRC